MSRLNDIEQATLAAGNALDAYLNAKNQWDRDAAKRELAHHQANLDRLDKAAGRLHYHPLGNMSVQDLLR